MRRLTPSLGLALVLTAMAAPGAEAHWLDRLLRGAGEATESAGGKAARLGGADAVEVAAAHIRKLPAKGDRALVVATTPEGHWRFVNTAGEAYTVGSPDEMQRVVGVLLPGAVAKADGPLALYLTEDAAHADRARLAELPKGAELHLVAGRDSYRLVRQGEGAATRLHAEVRPGLQLEVGERRLFAEALWQLARPLNKADIRVLALEPGGPARLASVPRFDAAGKRALVDALDPARLPAGLAAARGQTVLVSGRLDAGLLYYQPASGPERTLRLAELTRAAEAADVNLVVLEAATARQPGGRNWLWQRIDVAGLEQASREATWADFLGALGQGGLAVTATLDHADRAVLRALPVRGGPGAELGQSLGGALREMVAGVTGHVVVKAVHAYTASRERQRELELRLVPWLPSLPQYLYLAGLLLGLAGWRTARRWWAGLWPAPAADGGLAARLRCWLGWALFVAVVLPLVGIPAGLLTLLRAPFRTR